MHSASFRCRPAVIAALLLVPMGARCPAQQPSAAPTPTGSPPAASQMRGLPPSAPGKPAPLRPLEPRVQQVLAQARQAYKTIQTYQDLGSVTTTVVVAGRPAETTTPASTTFQQPGRFISNYQGMSLYSDGKNLWIYTSVRGKYYQQPRNQPSTSQTGGPTAESMLGNLPVLTMLTNPDRSLLTTATAFESAYRGQEQIAGHPVDHVSLVSPADAWFGATDDPQGGANRVTIDLFFDSQTHMLLRLNINMAGALRNRMTQMDQPRGPEQLNQASWQYNAGQVRLNTPISAEMFTFRPPANALKVETLVDLFSATGGAAPVNDEAQAEGEESDEVAAAYPAPNFTLSDLAGHPVALNDLRGHVIVMDFWATWCGPCRMALPHIQKMNEDFKNRGVIVLGVDVGEEPQTVLRFAESNRMSFRILLDAQGKVAELYKVTGIPHTVLIDQKGQVVRTHTGFAPGQENVLHDEVTALLTAPAAQSGATPPMASQPSPLMTGASQPTATQPGQED
jgi:thiol-disulfide isomerase/thioredoxin